MSAPTPSTIVVPDEKPKEETDEIGVSFTRMYPDTLFCKEEPRLNIAAQWLRTEEEIAILRANMEHSWVGQLLFSLKQVDAEMIMNYQKSVAMEISYLTDSIYELKKIDAEFLKTHTVLLISLPMVVGETTAKCVMENGAEKVTVDIELPFFVVPTDVVASYLVVLDEVIESQEQIAFHYVDSMATTAFEINWSTIEDQTE
jgi:hypothetical protein